MSLRFYVGSLGFRDVACAVFGDGELQPSCFFGEEFAEAVGPFGDEDGVLVEEFIPSEGEDFFGGFHSVEVEVMDEESSTGVFVEQAERGACDIAGGADAVDEAFGPVGFARAEVADEGEDCASGGLAGEVGTEVHHGLGCGGLHEL